MQLLSVIDPRDNLEKARRSELIAYARANGVVDITEQMPAMLIRKKLRALGLDRIRIPERTYAQPSLAARPLDEDGLVAEGTTGVTTDAADDLERQFLATAPRNPHTMAYNELRRQARELGVKLARKDNMAAIKAKVAAAMKKEPAG